VTTGTGQRTASGVGRLPSWLRRTLIGLVLAVGLCWVGYFEFLGPDAWASHGHSVLFATESAVLVLSALALTIFVGYYSFLIPWRRDERVFSDVYFFHRAHCNWDHAAVGASQTANLGTSHALDEHSVVGVALAAIVLATINFERLTALGARARNNT